MRHSAFSLDIPTNDVLIGAAIGALAGLAATIVMTQLQNAIAPLAKPKQKDNDKKDSGDDATVKTAQAVTQMVTSHKIQDENKALAGQIVHYSFGTVVGATYGILSEAMPSAAFGLGMPFGTALWLAADEAALPALGLSKSPTKYPVRTHAYGLASHLVYGASTELFRRGLRRLIVERE